MSSQRLARHPYRRQHATVGAASAGCDAVASGRGNGCRRELRTFVEDHGLRVLALARLYAAGASRNWAVCVTGSNTINVPSGTCWRAWPVSPGGRSTVSSVTSASSFSTSAGRSDRRTPEDIMILSSAADTCRDCGSRDLAHARAYREGHLTKVVERRLHSSAAQKAHYTAPDPWSSGLLLAENTGVQAWAHYVPYVISNMLSPTAQQRQDHRSSSMPSWPRDQVRSSCSRHDPEHPAPCARACPPRRRGRLTQGHKQSLGFVHAAMLHMKEAKRKPRQPIPCV